MAGKFFLPDARFRSPTAVANRSDMRDENVFSSIVLCHGGAGQQKVLTVPQGQSIPSLKGSAITVAQAHQLTYTELTTNLSKAGELGSAIGDASIRGIGLTLEQAGITPAGAINAFGATQYETSDILSKTFFQLKVAGKLQIQGAAWMFPAFGGVSGSIATTQSSTTIGLANNGWIGSGRRLKIPILVARTDTLEGVVGVAGSASYAFSTTTGAGQASLLWVQLLSTVRGDVR